MSPGMTMEMSDGMSQAMSAGMSQAMSPLPTPRGEDN